jgi:hypothetical protein
MATISAAAPTAGQPATARSPYILEKVVDFSVIAAAVTIGTTDTVQVLKLPASTHVSGAGYEILTAETTNTSAQVELGDGVDPNRWVASGVVSSTGVSASVATTSALGHTYASADTIDLLISVDDPTDAKIRVWAIVNDIKPVGNTADNATYTSA